MASNHSDLKFDLTAEFSDLVKRCSPALLMGGNPVEIVYGGIQLEKYEKDNDGALTRAIGEGANVYALWTRDKADDKWTLEYIGQRKKESCRERIKQHLFRVSAGTESKLEQVRSAVKQGRRVAISAILVSPDELRMAVEQSLIEKHQQTEGWVMWNTHGRKKRKDS